MVTLKDIEALDTFLGNRDIKYVLTGTSALFFHGCLPDCTQVHDIDIIVPVTDETQGPIETALSELEQFSRCEHNNSDYDGRVYVFKAGDNVTVNAFLGNPSIAEMPESQTMLIDEHEIQVHNVIPALRAKFKLGRKKDFEFFHKLVNQLTTLFKY
jgi:hypothetical protein